MNQTSFRRIWLLFTLLTLVLASCSQGPAEANVLASDLTRVTSPVVPPQDLGALSDGNQAFALDLYQALLEEENSNLFFSPYSVSAALAMTYAGARNETEKEMAEVLHFTLPQDRLHPALNALDLSLSSRGESNGGEEGDNFQLKIANAIWGQKDYEFLSGFLDVLAENYGAGLRVLDFAANPEKARQIINDWVYDKTEEKIEDLIPQGVIDSVTRLVLTNAIYFNAGWLHPFVSGNTYEGEFTLLDGTTRTVPMMTQAESFFYTEGEDYQAIVLPYEGSEVEMVILLPRQDGYEGFERSLDTDRLMAILGQFERKGVSLTLPKFEFESDLKLNEVLIQMGMPSAFGAGADFSGMDGTRNLFISDVLHKAFVSVDEAGTEAAAATAVVMKESAMMEPEVEVRMDHPFIFMIWDKETGAILFLGRVMNPGE